MRSSITLPVNTPETCRYFLVKGQRKKSGGKTKNKEEEHCFYIDFSIATFHLPPKKHPFFSENRLDPDFVFCSEQ